MAETSIEWADYTHNPWIGCEKISAGCKNCYASVDTYARVSASRGLPLWGPGASRYRTSKANWAKPLAWTRKARKRRHAIEEANGIAQRPRVFCASLADVFEGRADLDPWRADLWRLIEECDELDWLLLTKRPENVRGLVPPAWLSREYRMAQAIRAVEAAPVGWPSHVWLGTSVENQEQADARIPHLLAVPAPVRFLSLEPLLGPVELTPYLIDDLARMGRAPRVEIDWLIVGGESGPGARPCDVAWIRDLVRQGREADVAVFCKQLGAHALWNGISSPGEHWSEELVAKANWTPDGFRMRLRDPKGGDMAEWPEDLRVRQVPEVRR